MAASLTPPADNESDKADWLVDDAISKVVWQKIGGKWKELGRALQIPECQLDDIAHQHNGQGFTELGFQVLRSWRETASKNATVSFLSTQLKAIRRSDLADEIMNMPPNRRGDNHHSNHRAEISKAEWLKRLTNTLSDRYQKFVMKGLPWMDNIIITLAEYYVHLSVQTHHKSNNASTNISEVFKPAFSANKHPVRVLVEGPPGYGKTTLSAKLCFDYANSEDYIKNFDLVLHFSLRGFEGNLEKMFSRAADLLDSHDEEMFLEIIKNTSNRILLVLDGYDEVPEQHVTPILSLLQGKLFPHVAIVVTSRPGHFTFESWEKRKEGCSKQCELTFDWNSMWHTRINILGMNKWMKEVFIEKHLAEFPENTRRESLFQLEQMKDNDIIQPEFLECPLFLLMIILLSTDKDNRDIHNLITPTDLYKSIFNFIIRRYWSKQKEEVNENIDLFATNEDPAPFYVDLLCQFGDFAFWALAEDKLSFSRDEIIGTDHKRDERILDLGLLTQSVFNMGFKETVVFEPVHKSLLEFSAVYILWLNSTDGAHESWPKKVVHLLRYETRFGGLCLPMLAGLMQDRVDTLLDALKPYASGGLWAQWLERSISEINLTESVLSSVTPFLPIHWIQDNDDCFSKTHFDALLIHGIKEGRIKRVTLTDFLDTCMPNDVVVDTAVFDRIKDNMVNDPHKFRCKQLVFRDSHNFQNLETFVCNSSTRNFQTLSFVFIYNNSSQLRLLCDAITVGAMKDIHIRFLGCEMTENAEEALGLLAKLIKMERLNALSVTISMFQSPSALQEAMHSLLQAAANSSLLTSIVLVNWLLKSWTIDLGWLCGRVKKTWELLCVRKFNVEFNHIDKILQAKCLVLDCPDMPKDLFHYLNVGQVTSLQCKVSFLGSIENLKLLHEHLTELNVIMDTKIINVKQSPLMYLPNLNILTLTMTVHANPSFPVRDFLFGSNKFLRLKGIEIWDGSRNPKLAIAFMKCISECLKGNNSILSTCEEKKTLEKETLVNEEKYSHSLQLEYFLLRSHYFGKFLQFLPEMKIPLKNKSLPRFDIVVDEYTEITFFDIFSPAEGFRLETYLLGARSEDQILSRMEYDTQHLLIPVFGKMDRYKRFGYSVSFFKNKA